MASVLLSASGSTIAIARPLLLLPRSRTRAVVVLLLRVAVQATAGLTHGASSVLPLLDAVCTSCSAPRQRTMGKKAGDTRPAGDGHGKTGRAGRVAEPSVSADAPGTAAPTTPSSGQGRGGRTQRSPQHCSLCGEEGHNQRTCPMRKSPSKSAGDEAGQREAPPQVGVSSTAPTDRRAGSGVSTAAPSSPSASASTAAQAARDDDASSDAASSSEAGDDAAAHASAASSSCSEDGDDTAPACHADANAATDAARQLHAMRLADGEDGAEGRRAKPSNRERKAAQRQHQKEAREAAIRAASAEGAQFSVSQASASSAPAQSDTSLVKVENFNISAGGKELFVNASLLIVYGRRYGLVGPNGLGKTTLLKQIAMRRLAIPPNLDVLYVEQEFAAEDISVVEAVLSADVRRKALLEEQALLERSDARDAKANDRLKEVYDELAAIGADTAEPRARRILYGLGFDADAQSRPTRSFSGGWRMRVSLARALFLEPSLLLLDEPTNHLDLNAVIWLDGYLQRWKKMLLVVSHDQDFLNSVCTDIIHLENKSLAYYKGNYDSFKKMFEQKQVELKKAYEAQQRELKQLKASGHSSRDARDKVVRHRDAARGSAAKQAKKQQQRSMGGISEASAANPLVSRELMAKPKEYTVKFTFPEPPPLQASVIEVIDMGFHYPNGPTLFDTVNFGITMESRVTIVGPNGVGKSTLMDLMTGQLQPVTGEVRMNRKLRVGRYNQHFVDQLPMDVSPVEYFAARFNTEQQEARKLLGKFGLVGYAHVIPIRDLSGGQKARVVFASLHLQQAHVLFFDEPTNHLDIESIDALIAAINAFRGGVVVITHDARLIVETDMQLWVVGSRSVTPFHGDFEDYRNALLAALDDEATLVTGPTGSAIARRP